MTKKFSLAHLTVLGCAPPEMIPIAADAGYDFVGLRIIPLNLPGEPRYLLAEDKAMLRQTRAALAQTGVKLLDIEVARIADGVDVKTYLPALEIAAELGGKHVITSGWSEDRNFVAESFQQLCKLAEPLGLTVDFEFVSFTPYGSLAKAFALVTKSGCPNAGILVDTLHYDRAHDTLAELDALPQDLFHFAQLCDAPQAIDPTPEELRTTAREARLYLGEGDIPVKDIVRHMPEIPYSLEIANARRVQELGYAAFARECLETAQRYFAAPD
jgi:sugar phosphate isomerase/epimerase